MRCLRKREHSDVHIREAFMQLGLEPEGTPGLIHGASKRALLKNRWSAEVDVEIRPIPEGSLQSYGECATWVVGG